VSDRIAGPPMGRSTAYHVNLTLTLSAFARLAFKI
jgi:hypothetical protein